MDGFDAVIDQPELGAEVVETPESPETTTQEPEQQPGESDKKFSQRFSAWLKTTRDSATDPEIQKFARYGKDLEGRDRALRELYPNGVNDVREVKAALDGVQYGELKGIEAIGAIQDQIRDYEQSDELLASGDPKVLDLFGEEFNEGLGKLTPAILDRIQQSNPEAYNAAILPHLVQALRSSPLVQAQNALADVLNEEPPQWLTENQKSHWINDKFARAAKLNNAIAEWLNVQNDAVKNQVRPNGTKPGAPQDKLSQERQQFESQQRDYHWKTNIAPQLDQYAVKTFDQLFRPYNMRLKLDQKAQDALKSDFVQKVVAKAAQNKQYMGQIQRYRSQKTPDANTVLNLARVEFDKHAKGVMNEIIEERYRPFLGSKQSPTPAPAAKQPYTSPQNGVQYVSAKPPMNEIDHKNTPLDWLHQRKYRLHSGKVVQVRS